MKTLHALSDRRSSRCAIRMLLACALVLPYFQSAHADAGEIAGTWKGTYQCPLPTDLTLIIRHTGPREVAADFVFQAQGTPQRLPPGDFPMKGTYDDARKRVVLIPGTPRAMPPGFRTVRVTGSLVGGPGGKPALSIRLATCGTATLSRAPDVTAAAAYGQYANAPVSEIASQQSKDTPPGVAKSAKSRAEQREDRGSRPDEDARKKEIRQAQLEAEYAEKHALLAKSYSPRENALMAAPGRLPLIVPESYTEPDEEEIGLTMMREMTAGGGRMLTPHSIEVGVPPFDVFMPIQLDSARVEKEECRRLEKSSAYTCRFRHYLKVSLPARSWEFLGLGGKNGICPVNAY